MEFKTRPWSDRPNEVVCEKVVTWSESSCPQWLWTLRSCPLLVVLMDSTLSLLFFLFSLSIQSVYGSNRYIVDKCFNSLNQNNNHDTTKWLFRFSEALSSFSFGQWVSKSQGLSSESDQAIVAVWDFLNLLASQAHVVNTAWEWVLTLLSTGICGRQSHQVTLGLCSRWCLITVG